MHFEPGTLKQLLKLPVAEGTALVGARRVIGARVTGAGELALTLWVDGDGMLRNLEVAPSEQPEADDLLRALAKAMLKPARSAPCRPERVFVADRALGEQLSVALTPLGIDVGVMPDAGAAINAMLEAMDSASHSSLEGYLSQEGVTPDAVQDLFELAGEFFEMAPWETISSQMLLVLEGLAPEPLYCSILGSEGQEYGLALHPDLMGPRRMAQGKPPEGSLLLTYSPLEECGPKVAAEIEQLSLPLCEDYDLELRAPLLLQARRKKGNPMPKRQELQLALQALTALVDALETGASTVRVGDADVSLRYEDLAEMTRRRSKAKV